MKASDVFISAIEKEGVKYIFGVPGEENIQLLESIRKSSIKFIVTRHEQVAGFMAATVGRLTGTPGVCLSTLGPGATNFMTAIAYAQLGGMPALFITGQKPIKSSKQGHFQIINTVEMMRPLTKYSKQVTHAQQIPAMIREAFKKSMEERPGAVHIELPEDIASDEIDKPIYFNPINVRRPLAEDKAIDQAVKLIENAKRPLVLVGAGANRKRICNTLTAFINKTKIPFFTTQMGKGVVDERHKQFLGTAALSSNDYIHEAIDASDLIINIGHDIIEKPPFIMSPIENERKVIHINFMSAIPDMVYAPQLEVIGDIANAIWQITEKIKVQKTWELNFFEKIRNKIDKEFKSLESKKYFPYSPIQIVKQIREVMGDDDIVTLDNGMYKLWFTRHYETYCSNTLLLDNALATMGAGLPSAIAVKLIEPKKKVLTVTGDGGFLMNSQDLETAVRLKLDLVIVILKDNTYGMIEWKQKIAKLPKFGLTFSNPDFTIYAKAYGAKGEKVEKNKSLKELVNKAFKQGGVHIIEVPIDYKHKEKGL